jgi:hypothetical protein
MWYSGWSVSDKVRHIYNAPVNTSTPLTFNSRPRPTPIYDSKQMKAWLIFVAWNDQQLNSSTPKKNKFGVLIATQAYSWLSMV